MTLASRATARKHRRGLYTHTRALRASVCRRRRVATGLIAGNVYLFAASQGLTAWFQNCNKESLAAAIKPRPEQRVLFMQTVGYPK